MGGNQAKKIVYISRQEFEALVNKTIDAIPARYANNMKNVGFVIEDEPTPQQR